MVIEVGHSGEDFKGTFLSNMEGGNATANYLVVKTTQCIKIKNNLTTEELLGEEIAISFYGIHELIGFLTLMKLAVKSYEEQSGITL